MGGCELALPNARIGHTASFFPATALMVYAFAVL
jgi:hypothetical protein